MAFGFIKKKSGLINLDDVSKDMMYKAGMSYNSFYIMGQFRIDGKPAEYFYNFSIYMTPSGDPLCVTYFALNDGSGKRNIQDVQVFDKENIKLSTTELLIRTPRSELSGNLKNISFYVKFDDVTMNLSMKPDQKAISINASPVKSPLSQDLFQFDIPYCKTSGMISSFSNVYDISGSAVFGHEWRKKLSKPVKHVKMLEKARGEAALELPVFLSLKAKLANGKSVVIYMTEDNGQEVVWATAMDHLGEVTYLSVEGLLPQVNYFLAEAEEARLEKLEAKTREAAGKSDREMTETGILRAEENTRQNKMMMDSAEQRRIEALESMRKQNDQSAYNEIMRKQTEAEERAERKIKEAGGSQESGLTAILRSTGILKIGDQKRFMPVVKGESGNAIFDLYVALSEIDTTLRIKLTPERHDAMLPNYGRFQHFEGVTAFTAEEGSNQVEGYCYINIID